MKSPYTYWSKFSLLLPSVQQVVATLIFDSSFQLQPAVRRSTALNPRRLVYQADTLTICLELEESGSGRATLIGEIVPKDQLLPRRVELWADQTGEPVAVGAINDFGFFRLGDIRPATYTLVLRDVPMDPDGPEEASSGEIVLGPIAFTVGC